MLPDTESGLLAAFAALPGTPRVVASGNFATPYAVLGLLDKACASYRLNLLNAQPGIPDRPGVVHETSFVGPGMRTSRDLSYVPSRLSLLPGCSAPRCRPTWCWCTPPCRTRGRCRWAPRSTCSPRRWRRYGAGAGWWWRR